MLRNVVLSTKTNRESAAYVILVVGAKTGCENMAHRPLREKPEETKTRETEREERCGETLQNSVHFGLKTEILTRYSSGAHIFSFCNLSALVVSWKRD